MIEIVARDAASAAEDEDLPGHEAGPAPEPAPRTETETAPEGPASSPPPSADEAADVRSEAAPPPIASEPASGTAERPRHHTEPASNPIELYLLRHADAGDPAAWPGLDAERPLSKKGERQAKRLGRHLRKLDFQPDALLTSPKTRAAETAQIVARAVDVRARVDERLGTDFGLAELRALLHELDGSVERVVLVGHDPDFSDLASALVGAHVGLAKGAIGLIALPSRSPAHGRGELRWLLPPGAVHG